jgi:hypothetical protein
MGIWGPVHLDRPDLDLVMVTTAAWQNIVNAVPFDTDDIAIFIATQIMPAVHPD